MLEWATDREATVYCHWFQPLGSSGVRHGQSAQVQNHFFEFNKDGKPVWDFKGRLVGRILLWMYSIELKLAQLMDHASIE